MSSLWLVEGSSNGGNDVEAGMGKCGGVPDDGASDLVWESMMGGGNGSEWEVDRASALSRIIVARKPNGRIGLAGGRDNTGKGGDTSSGDSIGGSGGEGI
ncbi:hypothetical protein Tco_0151951 [Tanacetum coccineum]